MWIQINWGNSLYNTFVHCMCECVCRGSGVTERYVPGPLRAIKGFVNALITAIQPKCVNIMFFFLSFLTLHTEFMLYFHKTIHTNQGYITPCWSFNLLRAVTLLVVNLEGNLHCAKKNAALPSCLMTLSVPGRHHIVLLIKPYLFTFMSRVIWMFPSSLPLLIRQLLLLSCHRNVLGQVHCYLKSLR